MSVGAPDLSAVYNMAAGSGANVSGGATANAAVASAVQGMVTSMGIPAIDNTNVIVTTDSTTGDLTTNGGETQLDVVVNYLRSIAS